MRQPTKSLKYLLTEHAAGWTNLFRKMFVVDRSPSDTTETHEILHDFILIWFVITSQSIFVSLLRTDFSQNVAYPCTVDGHCNRQSPGAHFFGRHRIPIETIFPLFSVDSNASSKDRFQHLILERAGSRSKIFFFFFLITV